MDNTSAAISFITLGVSDLAEMQTFYSGLDFELHAQSDSVDHPYVMYKSGRLILALYPEHLLAKQAGVSFNPDSSNFLDKATNAMSISLNVSNKSQVDEFLITAKRLGAEVTREGFEPPWGGYCGYVKDPENNLWEIVWHENYEFSA